MCGQMAVHNQFCMDIFKSFTDIELVPLCYYSLWVNGSLGLNPVVGRCLATKVFIGKLPAAEWA